MTARAPPKEESDNQEIVGVGALPANKGSLVLSKVDQYQSWDTSRRTKKIQSLLDTKAIVVLRK
ncbi:hypothetical protein N7476_010507 [Penicillium atrosanguineum]|uniref:Uncharacterized protein n=1 Tax=Penicillium atrosanguineum TaxID=1132637 RepID=A0A9W9PTF5_9EURO|nr:hypothetical protein N7476_010507 [Penicillium atrosanguineum]